MCFRLLPFLLVLLLVGCDRFADEERGLDLRVLNVNGNAVRHAEVHIVLHFSPPYRQSTSPPVRFSLSSLGNVTYRVVRRTGGADVLAGSLGILGPGQHTFSVSGLDLPNGLYELELTAGEGLVKKESILLNRIPEEANDLVALGRTGANGQVFIGEPALSQGERVILRLQGGQAIDTRVTDSLTVWVVPPGAPPLSAGILLSPVGTTRAIVRVE